MGKTGLVVVLVVIVPWLRCVVILVLALTIAPMKWAGDVERTNVGEGAEKGRTVFLGLVERWAAARAAA